MSKRQEMREKRKRQERLNRLLVIGLIIVGAFMVVGFFVYQQYKPVGAITVPTPQAYTNTNFNSMGDPNAPVKMVEYSDYQCPFCARFHRETEEQIIQNFVNTGKVYFTSRSFGNWVSRGANTESQDAAAAAYCAGDQGKYWEYHDMLFANQNGENIGDFVRRRLDAFAQTLGLDTAQFKSCMDSGKYADRVTQDGVDGLAAIKAAPNYDANAGYGTPTFIINGYMIEGAQPYDTFKQAIESALAGGSPAATPTP